MVAMKKKRSISASKSILWNKAVLYSCCIVTYLRVCSPLPHPVLFAINIPISSSLSSFKPHFSLLFSSLLWLSHPIRHVAILLLGGQSPAGAGAVVHVKKIATYCCKSNHDIKQSCPPIQNVSLPIFWASTKRLLSGPTHTHFGLDLCLNNHSKFVSASNRFLSICEFVNTIFSVFFIFFFAFVQDY